jgi:hypothetical protein
MSDDGRRARRTAALLAAVAVVISAGFGGLGCTSSGNDDSTTVDRNDAGADSAGADRGSRTTEPPGSDSEAVTGYVEELLRRYDDAVATIIVDPAVVRDRSDPVVVEYLDLFEPGSEDADAALAGWADSADAGPTVRPINADTPMITSRLDGDVETVDDDEVGFATCAEHHYQLYDGQGVVQDVVEMVGRAGQGVAVRVDGRWRLRRLELRDDRPACATTSTAEGDGS